MMQNIVRSRYLLVVALTAAALAFVASGSAGAFTSTGPRAQALTLRPHPMTTTVSGSTTGAIFEAINTSSTAFNTFGLEGIVANAPGGIGVLGYGNNMSVGNYGMYGSVLGPNGTGVYGYATFPAPVSTPNPSTLSVGVIGLSLNGFGVIGQTQFPNISNTTTNPMAGIEGVDLANSGHENYGVLGTTTNGGFGAGGLSGNGALGGLFGLGTNEVGVEGISTSSDGGFFTTTSGIGVDGESSTGAGVFSASSSSFGSENISSSGYGALGQTSTGSAGLEAFADGITAPSDPAGGGTGNAAYFQNNSSHTTIWAYQSGSGALLNLESAAHGIVFTADNAGNVTISGLIHTAGTCASGCRAGRAVIQYTPRVSVPTTEDVGEAQLVSGQAYVRLDPAFANVIDTTSSYLVFVTPEGDSNGMYVTGKTPAGFVVRENRGGRSTVAFEYRIVAKPLGVNAPRLPMVQMAQQAGAGLGRALRTGAVVYPRMSAKQAQFLARLRANPIPRITRVPGPHPFIH